MCRLLDVHMIQFKFITAIFFAIASITATSSIARESLEVVGFSTVYLFATVVADKWIRLLVLSISRLGALAAVEEAFVTR